ncbi:hypothetical protein [Pantoea ananatis]|uniref:hypothetical protein n=1 Tax=Pantoea ananas TaxID=553 RepID=UPI000DA670B2|nr:hypothetical protein [Pantoea ananatis]PZD63545.1 hypothetical protein ARC272_11755 [Pantoea ananatis]
MSRNLTLEYCVIQQIGNLEFHTPMLFNDSKSGAVRLLMQINIDTLWMNPDAIVIVADPTPSQTMQICRGAY